MGRTPCCDKKGWKRGQWTAEEDEILVNYITKHGHTSWRSIPQLAGLSRCGKSCRLRWKNYLRPDIKRGPFTAEEEKLVVQLHVALGNRWAAIASHLPRRTNNEIKNLWNTHLKKRLIYMGIDPQTHEPAATAAPTARELPPSPSTRHMAQWESARLEAEARVSKDSLFHNDNVNDISSNTESDYLLRIWNSEAGEGFRSFERTPEKPSCESQVSQASSSDNKCGSIFAPTKLTYSNREHECKLLKLTKEEEIMRSYSSISNDMDRDSSESALQLLLEVPVGSNEMYFLEDNNYP